MRDFPRRLEVIRQELDDMLKLLARKGGVLPRNAQEAAEHMARARQAVGVARQTLMTTNS